MTSPMKERSHSWTQAEPSDDVWDQAFGALVAAGVTDVFGLPDDDMRAMGAIERQGLRLHRVVRQATAVHMASGHAASGRSVGACVLGRGPAVAAAVPGLLEAWESGRPMVVLASGTAEVLRGTGAFQDAPTVEMVRPITKRAHRVTDPALIDHEVTEALRIAQAAPAGPVYLEIPDREAQAPEDRHCDAAPIVDICDLAGELSAAQRPLLLLGSGAGDVPPTELVGLAEQLGAGVVVTASGRGCFPEGHPAFLGLSGLYLLPEVAPYVREADMVLALGSRLEETALVGMPMGGGTQWLQVNLAPEHLVRRLPGLCAVADVSQLTALHPQSSAGHPWAEAVAQARADCYEALHRDIDSRAAQVLAYLSDGLPEGAVTVHENGLHDIWSYSFPHLQLPQGSRSVVLSEQTTLGGGVAAAAGIAAAGQSLVVCLTGDTALSTLSPDLHDILGRPCPLLYVVFDDGGMGWLDREARGSGVEERFVGGSGFLDTINPEHVIVANNPSSLCTDAILAVERSLADIPTLLWVPVAHDDVAPQLRDEGSAA